MSPNELEELYQKTYERLHSPETPIHEKAQSLMVLNSVYGVNGIKNLEDYYEKN